MAGPVSIDTLEMVLNEQAEKDENLRLTGEIIVNREMLERIKDLQAKKRRLIGNAEGSTGGAAGIDTSEVDGEIDAAIAAAEEFIVRPNFRAVSGDEYLRVVARHPEARNGYDETNVALWHEFLIDLATTCYTGCTFRGTKFTKEQYPLAKLTGHAAVGFGQLKPIYDGVLDLNQDTPDRSFLSKPSKPSPTT